MDELQNEGLEVVCVTQGGCSVTWTATKTLTLAGTALCSMPEALAGYAVRDARIGELEAENAEWSPVMQRLGDENQKLRAELAALREQEPMDCVRSEAEQCLFVLSEIGSMDAEDITGDDVDLRFDDEDGRDTGCDVSIVGYAERAAKVIESMLAAPAVSDKYTYASKQETECGGCGVRKHTPLRVDWMGGYVCLTCIDNKLEELYDDQQAEPAVSAEQQGVADGLEPSGYDDLWLWFGSSRSSWLTLPRSLMHAMPDKWQKQMAGLLDQWDASWNTSHLPVPYVSAREGRRFTFWPEWLLNYRRTPKAQINSVRAAPAPSTTEGQDTAIECQACLRVQENEQNPDTECDPCGWAGLRNGKPILKEGQGDE